MLVVMETQCENEKQSNIFFFALYPILLVCAIWILYLVHVEGPERISAFDFILLSLATFRLIRLLVYDRVTQFVRDWFFEEPVLGMPPRSGFKASLRHLFGCPWCMGIWAGFFVAFVYYLAPFAWFFILVLAIAGAASILQSLANMIGRKTARLSTTEDNAVCGL